MTLLALIVALLLEQIRPLPVDRFVLAPLRRVSASMIERFNDGRRSNGRLAWALVIIVVTLASVLAYFLLWRLHPVFALVFNVAVLYLTMGFRQESHFFTDIHLALRMGELDRARQLLGEWRGIDHRDSSSSEVARLAIERALIGAHRNVFGVCFWFVVLPGPAGAVLYRVARFFAEEWGRRRDPEFGSFGAFAGRAFEWLDWLPARVTAVAFSIAGDFEDAIFCWRTQALQWPDRTDGILIASGAGALGVRLGMPVHEFGEVVDRPEIGAGDEADADFMQATVGLVWRSLVLCLLLLVLLAIAGWVGH